MKHIIRLLIGLAFFSIIPVFIWFVNILLVKWEEQTSFTVISILVLIFAYCIGADIYTPEQKKNQDE